MFKVNNKIIDYITIKNKQKPVYSGMEVLSINNLFDIKAGGDVSKINYKDNKDAYYKYPIYSNYISNDGLYGYSDTFKVHEEAITITARGTIGKTFYRNQPFTPIGRLLYLRSKKEDVDMRYFSYLIDNIGIEGEGGVINSLTAPMIKKYELKFFSNINQQKKIATTLSQQEEQVNKIKTLIEKLEKRNQYYAERLLSGELRVREGADGEIVFYENEEWIDVKLNGQVQKIPKDWSLKKVEDIAKLINGFAFKKNEMLNEGKYPVIKMNNFKKGNIVLNNLTKYTNTEKENVKLYKGDLIMGLSGSVGSTAIFNLSETCLLNQRCLIVRARENDLFIKNCLTDLILKYVKKESHGGVIANLSHKDIANFEICYSNNHFLISKVIDSLKFEKTKIEELLEKEQKRFDWMSDALLSGEYQIVD